MRKLSENRAYSVSTLCLLFGKSRQAYYKSVNEATKPVIDEDFIIKEVKAYRVELPKCGVRKLFEHLTEDYPEIINFGRDALFDLLRDRRMLVRQRKKRVVTTQSYHWLNRYDNLIKELKVERPNQVWVSDITYIRYANKFCYLFLITDLYTRKIVGFKVADTLEAKHALDALKMARRTAKMDLNGLIHHSDHGVQYCCSAYIEMLDDMSAVSSMAAKGNPYENAVAERVNGILKNEWLDDEKFKTFDQVDRRVKQVVKIYNSKRLHMSLNYKTPDFMYYKAYENVK